MNLVSGFPTKQVSVPDNLTVVSYWIKKQSLLAPKIPTKIINDYPNEEILSSRYFRLIYLQFEPEAIVRSRAFLLKNSKRFYKILTYDAKVLQSCHNAVQYVVGGCWVHTDERKKINQDDKQFAVSTIVGTKVWGEGHVFRSVIYSRQKEIESIPYTFYRSVKTGALPEITNNPPFTWDSKFELFRTYQYSIAIENSKQENYFTEKLIDCFVTKTIPIYWGCPNIGRFFRTDGMILLETTTFEEVKAKLDQLTPETYAAKKDAIEENYQRALQYINVEENINKALQNIKDY